MNNLSFLRRRPAEPAAALTEATEQLCRATTTLAAAGQALIDAQHNHECLANTLATHMQALTEQVELHRREVGFLRDCADRIDGRLNAIEEWFSKMRRLAPKWFGSDVTQAFTQLMAALASHYPPGRDPDAPFGGGRS